jgi:hypothetical protein
MKNAKQFGYYDRTEACHEDGSDQPIEGWAGDGYYVLTANINGLPCLVGYDTEAEAKAAAQAGVASTRKQTTERQIMKNTKIENYSVRESRNGQFIPQVNGKDVSPTSFDRERALGIARQSWEKSDKLTCTPAVAAVRPVKAEFLRHPTHAPECSVNVGLAHGEICNCHRMLNPVTSELAAKCAAGALDGLGCENADYYHAEFAKIEKSIPRYARDGVTLIKLACGCKVQRGAYDDSPHELLFCATHKAAPDLLAALEKALPLLDYLHKTPKHNPLQQDLTDEAFNTVLATLASANGKK